MTQTSTELRCGSRLAAQLLVLVAVDFNGTLAPFVLDPLQARAPATHRRSRDACGDIGVKPNDFRTATLRSIGRAAWVR